PGDGVLGLRAVGGPVVGPLVGLEVGHVLARPPPLVLIPPDEPLALRPRLALGVGGGAVVEDAPVRGPGPRPVRGHPTLLARGRAPRRLFRLAGEAAAVDPAAAGGRAVVLQ